MVILIFEQTQGSSYHVLLSNVALNVATGMFLLEELGEGGVLCVAIQGNHSIVGVAQFCQCNPVSLAGGPLQKENTPGLL